MSLPLLFVCWYEMQLQVCVPLLAFYKWTWGPNYNYVHTLKTFCATWLHALHIIIMPIKLIL